MLGYLACGLRHRLRRRPDWPRSNAVHPNAAVNQVLGKRLGESMNRPLRSSVVDQGLVPLQTRDRAAVDDRHAPRQVRDRRAGHVEVPVDVRPKRGIEVLVRDVFEFLAGLLVSGVVDEAPLPTDVPTLQAMVGELLAKNRQLEARIAELNAKGVVRAGPAGARRHRQVRRPRPVHRLAGQLARSGVTIASSTLGDWLGGRRSC